MDAFWELRSRFGMSSSMDYEWRHTHTGGAERDAFFTGDQDELLNNPVGSRLSSTKRKMEDSECLRGHFLRAKVEELSLNEDYIQGSVLNSEPLVHFFVRGYPSGTMVLHMSPHSSIAQVHEELVKRTGIPIVEQRLMYGGRQLYHEQTLCDLKVTDNVTLQLNSRMRSTDLPETWKIVMHLVGTINDIQHHSRRGGQPASFWQQEAVRNGVKLFLKRANDEKKKNKSISDQMGVFQMAGGVAALMSLLLSPIESNADCAESAVNLFITNGDPSIPQDVYPYCGPILLQFCQFLSKFAPKHTVYRQCRTALSCLVERVGLVPKAGGFGDIVPYEVITSFAPFVNELAATLFVDVCVEEAYLQRNHSTPPAFFSGHAQEFVCFLVPLCRAMQAFEAMQACHCGLASFCQKCRVFRRSTTIWKDTGNLMPYCQDQSVSGLDCKSCCAGAETANDRNTKPDADWSLEWLQNLCCNLFKAVLRVFNLMQSLMEEEKEVMLKTYCKNSTILCILKGLSQFASKFPARSKCWFEGLRECSSALNFFILNSEALSQEAVLSWMLPFKELLTFESKRKLVMIILPEQHDEYEERHEVVVYRRASLLAESFEAVMGVDSEQLHNGLTVEFADEVATGPGVTREWFALVARETFNPENALFVACPHDRRRFYPNAASGVNPGHLTYFRFCGRILALALMHRVQLDIVLSKAFFKQLTHQRVLLEDIEEIDPDLHRSCRAFLEMEALAVDNLSLTFTWDIEELGVRRTIDLIPDGESKRVTAANMEEFIELLIQKRLVLRVAEQVRHMVMGLRDVLNDRLQTFLHMLDPEDFNLLLHGTGSAVNASDWKRHTEYHDYSPTDREISWFWEVVEEMDEERRGRLLFFATAVMRLPVEGFSGLPSKFHIHKTSDGPSYCPRSHTCFFQLVLPQYTSLEMTRERLYTITENHPTAMGFGFP